MRRREATFRGDSFLHGQFIRIYKYPSFLECLCAVFIFIQPTYLRPTAIAQRAQTRSSIVKNYRANIGYKMALRRTMPKCFLHETWPFSEMRTFAATKGRICVAFEQNRRSLVALLADAIKLNGIAFSFYLLLYQISRTLVACLAEMNFRK